METAKTIVLGLGNLIQSDDGVGVIALQRMREDRRIPSGVEFIEGGTKGLELLPYILGCSKLLVLDAIDVDAEPGTVLRMEGDELRALPGSGSAHELALPDLMVALRMLGQEPPELVLLGIQPGITSLGTSLSSSVEAALPHLMEAGLVELSCWAAAEKNLNVENVLAGMSRP